MGKPKIIIVSGYFNPLHKGHIELFEKAKTKGDQLWVIVNSDFQREIKGSKFFMNQEERLIIIKSIVFVDKALISLDKDNTQCSTLSFLSRKYSSKYDIIFANGIFQIQELRELERINHSKKKKFIPQATCILIIY